MLSCIGRSSPNGLVSSGIKSILGALIEVTAGWQPTGFSIIAGEILRRSGSICPPVAVHGVVNLPTIPVLVLAQAAQTQS